MRSAVHARWATVLGLATVGGCALSPTSNDADRAVFTTEARQPVAARGILVDAMPVSMGAPVETIQGERTYIVTVRLLHGGQPVNFKEGQEFAVQYVVTHNGGQVLHDNIVLPTSPRFVMPRGRAAPAFKFLVQTTKAPGAGYELQVRVHLGDVTGESPAQVITQ